MQKRTELTSPVRSTPGCPSMRLRNEQSWKRDAPPLCCDPPPSIPLSLSLSRSLFFYKSGNYKPVSGKRTPAHTCRLPLTTYTTSPTTALVSWTAFEHTRRVPWSTFLSGKHSTVIYRFQCNLVFKSIKLSSGSKNVQFCGDFSTSLYF